MTISSNYIELLKKVHNDKSRKNAFGGKVKDLGDFYFYFNMYKPTSVLDYGCGKGAIIAYLKERYSDVVFDGYDPAVPMFSAKPSKAYDGLFCNDVLEHIEPEYLTQVLQELNSYARKFIWLRIDTQPARKKLPDGRNAHLIVKSDDWWLNKIHENISGTVVYSNVDRKGKFDVAIEKNDS